MKKLIAGIFAVLAMASVSFAAQTAVINVTSEPVVQGATCGKAGGFTMSFDNGTVFTVGDKITFDLDLNTTLCKDVSAEIGMYASATAVGPITGAGLGGALQVTGAGTLTASGTGVTFRLIGTKGSSRVTLSVLGAAGETLTFASTDTSDKFLVKFLDGTDYTAATTGGVIYEYTPAAGSDPAAWERSDVEHNSLCIDVSETTAATIDANFDSANDIYTFEPSDPQVAHIVSGATYSLYETKNRETGNIFLPEAGDQTSCYAINNEVTATSAAVNGGFCTTGDLHRDNEVILKSDNEFSLDGEVQVTLEILVNGKSGANGVYWAGSTIATKAAAAAADVASAATVNISATSYKADGTTTATFDGDATDCEVEEDDKGVILKGKNTSALLGMDATNKFIWFDLPSMHYDTSEVSKEDVVSVKITVETLPCGLILADTWKIGTFGCVSATSSYAQRYPYFAKEGSYANALIITNVDSKDGVATLTLYEEDGDIFTATVNVEAKKLYVNLVGNLTWTATAASAGSGTVGDARGWLAVSADFSVDGAAMITNATTGESIGYLPRQ